MALLDEIQDGVDGVLSAAWDRRDGNVVPTSDSVVLRNGAVDVSAAYLYADLADSSSLAQNVKDWAAAKVIRSYLNLAVRILQHHGGEIRSFDGDRVMAIFMGAGKEDSAVTSALKINWALDEVLKPKLSSKWPDLKSWKPDHGIGIDTGTAMIVRGGVRDDNDLIRVGAAPNIAAKLSEIRATADIYITRGVYDALQASNRSTNGKSMWSDNGFTKVGGKSYTVYSSSWRRKP